jgi:AcrR family transcriptional regulator
MSNQNEGLRGRKKRELKAEIVRFGLELFTREGFRETTVEDIVGPLGVSKRTFFRYFAGKEDLVFAWYEELTGELTAALAARPNDEPPLEAVSETLRSLLHHYDEEREHALALLRLSKATPSLIGKSYEKRALWERELAAVLERRLPKSSTRALRAKVITGAALTAFTLGVDDWAESQGKRDIRASLDRAFAALKGL